MWVGLLLQLYFAVLCVGACGLLQSLCQLVHLLRVLGGYLLDVGSGLMHFMCGGHIVIDWVSLMHDVSTGYVCVSRVVDV